MPSDHSAIRPTWSVLVVLAGTLACGGEDRKEDTGHVTPADEPVLPSRGFFKGLLPVPGDGQELDAAYVQAAEHAEFVPVWATGIGSDGFWDYPDDLAGWGGETFVEGLIRGNGMFPIIHFSFLTKEPGSDELSLHTPPGMEDATLSDPAWRAAYVEAALDATRASRPLYLSIGNEVNRWYEQVGAEDGDPNGFQHFVSLYEEVYDAVKEVSPETNVFCVFARENVDALREADLAALDLFDPARQDLAVFTTYPHSVRTDEAGEPLDAPHDRPADVPDDYYVRAAQRFPGKPFGFSEVAWPSTDAFGGESAQADFVTEATGRLTSDQGLDLRLFGWPWLHDLAEGDDVGLIRRDGTEKEAYGVWGEL